MPATPHRLKNSANILKEKLTEFLKPVKSPTLSILARGQHGVPGGPIQHTDIFDPLGAENSI